MKRILALLISASLLVALVSCSKADGSSSSSVSSSSLPTSSSASQSASQSQNSSSASQASSSQSSSQASSSQSEINIDDTQWPMSFINITASDGTAVLVEAAVPDAWKFDKYTTYSEGEKKVMEVMYAEKIIDKDNPYKIPNFEQFTSVNGEAADGYISSQEIILPTTKAMLHLRKDYPQDSETPVYPHIYLVQKGDYIVVVSFTAYDENCQQLHKTYDAILDKLQIYV